MANDVTIREEYVPYIPGPDDDSRVDEVVRNALSFSTRVSGVLFMQNVPTDVQRKALQVRQRLLVNSLKHDKTMVRLLIGQMLQSYRGRAIQPNETIGEVTDLYVRELSLDPAVPTWAVQLAVNAIRLGGAEGISLIHPPSTIAVRRVADGYAWKVRAQIPVISDILNGKQAMPELSAEDRDRVKLFWRNLADELKGRQSDDEETRRAAAQTASDRLVALVGREKFDAIPNAPAKVSTPSAGRAARKVATAARA